MTWNEPINWEEGDRFNANIFNRQIKENHEHLFRTPRAFAMPRDVTPPTDPNYYIVSSSTLEAVDDTIFKLTLTTTGGQVKVIFSGALHQTVDSSDGIYLNVFVDDTAYYHSSLLVEGTNAEWEVRSFMLPFDLAAGEHTFSLHWAVGAGLGYIQGNIMLITFGAYEL